MSDKELEHILKLMDGYDPNEGRVKEEDIFPNNLLKELAYHEAAHFLIDNYNLRKNIGFTEIMKVKIMVSQKEIIGFVEKIDDNKWSNPKQVKDFFLFDIQRVACKVLTLAAGYATYQQFVNKDTEYYIGVFNEDSKKIMRYKLDTFQYYDDSHDYYKLQACIKYLGIKTRVSKLDLIRFLNMELQKFMDLGGNKSALGYVKNRLIENNGTEISNQELEKIVARVNDHTKSIKFDYLVSRVVEKLEELKAIDDKI